MKFRRLGKTNFNVSEISLGTWQVGGKWGSPFDHENADRILNTAFDLGINFIDTADVYEGGLSEKAVGKAIKNRKEKIIVATKCGRQTNPHIIEKYTPDALHKYVDDSLKRLELETIDLIQLHCPPPEVYDRQELFQSFEKLKAQGKIQHLGVSVETVDEAMKAIEYENVATIQIIFNLFRQKPADIFFKKAKEKDIGIIVRVPLASGLLTGTYHQNTTFTKGDHRNFNRDGAAFDKGETFSGVDFDLGLHAVNQFKELFPGMKNLAPIALKWILQHDAVSCIIPGASRPAQVLSNVSVYDLPPITTGQMAEMNSIYEKWIKPEVHHLW
jgi:aryl-alcohol dehydrogenase-like predicted oxidoreductase